jgi:hypothetical protein
MACAHSDPESAIITLCDLPTELLLEIVQNLENPDLLSLGLTCRRMQSAAFNTFFANNDICDPAAGWLVALKTPVETLPVLRGALFIQKLDYLNYYFNPGVERMIEELQDRLDTQSISLNCTFPCWTTISCHPNAALKHWTQKCGKRSSKVFSM